MSGKLTGHCLCGAVKYECAAVAGPAGYCHCEDCRRCTGSAFNVSVRLDAAAFRLAGGRLGRYTKRGDSGAELTRHFCVNCGSPIYTSSPGHPESVFVKAGTLDDPALVRPAHQAWVGSAVPWSRIDPALPSFEKDGG
jgi:hypothetical protein